MSRSDRKPLFFFSFFASYDLLTSHLLITPVRSDWKTQLHDISLTFFRSVNANLFMDLPLLFSGFVDSKVRARANRFGRIVSSMCVCIYACTCHVYV